MMVHEHTSPELRKYTRGPHTPQGQAMSQQGTGNNPSMRKAEIALPQVDGNVC